MILIMFWLFKKLLYPLSPHSHYNYYNRRLTSPHHDIIKWNPHLFDARPKLKYDIKFNPIIVQNVHLNLMYLDVFDKNERIVEKFT